MNKYPKVKTLKWVIPAGTVIGVKTFEIQGDSSYEFKDTNACVMMDIHVPSAVDNSTSIKIQDSSVDVILDYLPLAYIQERANITDNLIRKITFPTKGLRHTFNIDLKAVPGADIEIYLIFFLQ